MTREEIEAKWETMTPRERDAWIAEVLFGWYRIKGPKTDYDGLCEYGDVLIPPEITSEEEAFRLMPPKGSIPFDYFVNRKWSTDISEAWKVVEKMLETHWVDIYSGKGSKLVKTYECRMGKYGVPSATHSADADTAPEAICKAALLAVLEG